MNTIKGTPISPGISIGKAFIKKTAAINIFPDKNKDVTEEKERFYKAKSLAIKQLEDVYNKLLGSKDKQEASIFLAHIEMINDIELNNGVEAVVDEKGCNAEWAVKTVCDNIIKAFEDINDEYMKERAIDVKDIRDRIIRILQGDEYYHSLVLEEPSIIVTDELKPSDTAEMSPDLILGIICESGGVTSHAAIIARTLGIPFVVYSQILKQVKHGQMLAFDGDTGFIEIEVDEYIYNNYFSKQEAFLQSQLQLEKQRGKKSVTKDGYEIILAGNIGAPEDAEKVLQQDGHSIGLFRTEFLYMNRNTPPEEEEQFTAYKKTVEKMHGNPVIIRTLDIGGDKEVDYLNIPKEDNPFLGYRAIRLCLDRVSFWKVQLRALLRASAFGNIHIMFPLIASLDELMRAKQMLVNVKAELRSEGVAFNVNIPVGMMIETPAAALMSDVFAKEVDFFSIGTNDLIQYTMAVDRMNRKVANLYSQYDPAVLRLIKMIVDNAHENDIRVGICGEAAADLALLPVWVGMELDELSMAPVSILKIREQIRELSRTDCVTLVDKILVRKTAKEIEQTLISSQS